MAAPPPMLTGLTVHWAEKSVPFLRSAQCAAMIIVVSSHVDRRRRAQVLALGVGDVIDKDELDSTSISQALIHAQQSKQNKL